MLPSLDLGINLRHKLFVVRLDILHDAQPVGVELDLKNVEELVLQHVASRKGVRQTDEVVEHVQARRVLHVQICI
eukprot:CAMPEP_0205907082 /NCGR_PEP_ID=MMETSP1325-20131115/2320_1 /ASSEMBLY_ACC=CAM_ASM_000708 /TAXON_ID=236786 /ORGANISM="Florenciella sp., Strain RCC1007" /LENGTH=74 /DNA_ID=CAMNT_0053273145 /DNA_START=599 /DNA_END=823 /DNA_ORIENTATION=-